MTKKNKGNPYSESLPLPKLPLWEKFKDDRVPNTIEYEMTPRCNNNCRHCYINLPAADPVAMNSELSIAELEPIAEQASKIGFFWWILSGGEPLLRNDFFDIYLLLKKKGFLVSVFTNATLIQNDHIRIFLKYPPRNIEVTVYGVTEKTYERVTCSPGSFKAFRDGLDKLLGSGLHIHLKAMALRSNFNEFPEIVRFCREHSPHNFRIDSFLHLRYDADPFRNEMIRKERLSPDQVVEIERLHPEKIEALRRGCERTIVSDQIQFSSMRLIRCGAGNNGITLSYDGMMKPCMPLCHPGYMFDLRRAPFLDGWYDFLPSILKKMTRNKRLIENCGSCLIRSLCQLCPGSAFLETGDLEGFVDAFCLTAQKRAAMVGHNDSK